MTASEIFIQPENEEDEDTLGTEIENYLNCVLAKAGDFVKDLSLSGGSEVNNQNVTSQINSLLAQVDKAVSFVGNIMLSTECSLQHELEQVYESFLSVLRCMGRIFLNWSATNAVNKIVPRSLEAQEGPGRPKFKLPQETLEELRELGFSWTKIAKMLGVSRWTISRRITEYGLNNMQGFTEMKDEELDSIVNEFVNHHSRLAGQVYTSGYLQSLGLRIQRQRVRESLVRVDPDNRVLRWGVLVSRPVYYVPWPNSVWHMDGHHSLIRWGMVVHGCIDGFSRKIMFLKCSSNNCAETVLELFLNAVEDHNNFWPSRIRVNRGVENVRVCDVMVEMRGNGRDSFIAGPSTRNQRIERLWRDVFRCVCHYFYYVFYAMEQCGLIDVDNKLHMFLLHLIFIPRINFALDEFKGASNEHKIRTARNWSPNQLWINGMMDINNPLSHGELDENPQNLELYGEDPQGPTPFDDSENEVIVLSVELQGAELQGASTIANSVLQVIDPLMESNKMGIDIYSVALEQVLQNFYFTD